MSTLNLDKLADVIKPAVVKLNEQTWPLLAPDRLSLSDYSRLLATCEWHQNTPESEWRRLRWSQIDALIKLVLPTMPRWERRRLSQKRKLAILAFYAEQFFLKQEGR